MISDVTILSTTCKTLTIWREINSMYWTETTMDFSQFLIEYYTEQLQLEATTTLIVRGESSFSSINSSTNDTMELLQFLIIKQWTYCYCSTWYLSKCKDSNLIICLRVQQLRCSIFGGCEEHSIIVCQEDLIYFCFVNIHLLKSLS